MAKDSAAKGSAARAKANEAIHEIRLAGNQLVDKVRDLIEEGNVRRVIIKKDDRVLLEVPLTVSAGAAAAAMLWSPMLAAVGALAALVTDVTLVVERDGAAGGGETSGGEQKTVGRGAGDRDA